MARGEETGISVTEDPKRKAPGEVPSEAIVLRDFGGVNVQSPREDIGDNEFSWLEELIPVAPGNLVPVLGPSAALVTITETGAPTFSLSFSLAGVDTVLAIWAGSGNAWVGAAAAGAIWTQIATGLFTSGKTAAAAWSNTGVLIVDPVAGYYDYGVTTPATLTNLSGTLYGPTMTTVNPAQLATGTVPPLRVTDSTGTGGTIGASATTATVTLATAGTGYSVGDVLTAAGGTLTTSTAAPASQQNQPLVLTVTAVSSGAVTAFAITNPGYYQTAPANPVNFPGTGFTATVKWTVGNPYVITQGQNYSAPVVQAFIGGVWVAYAMTINTSGALKGTAIATYAGRAWIAISRTVQFTDAGSYNSFGNSGSAFTINDSYLHNNITALYAANNYLYIFGDDSVDILSNVTVVNGIAQFSRINASSSIGTTQPLSIYPFIRGLAFANNSGFYVLSGATPEKVSDKLDGLIATTNFAASIYGCQVMIDNILCAAFLVNFTDSFTRSPAQARSVLAVLFRGRWWFTSQLPASGANLAAVVSYPVGGLSTMFGWAGNSLYRLVTAVNVNRWLLRTRLWDLGAPILDKQSIMAAIGVVLGGAASSGLTVNVDTEYASTPTNIGVSFPFVQWVNNANALVQWVNNANALVTWEASPSGYQFLLGDANTGNGKFMGLTATGNANTTQIRLLALDLIKRRRW